MSDDDDDALGICYLVTCVILLAVVPVALLIYGLYKLIQCCARTCCRDCCEKNCPCCERACWGDKRAVVAVYNPQPAVVNVTVQNSTNQVLQQPPMMQPGTDHPAGYPPPLQGYPQGYLQPAPSGYPQHAPGGYPQPAPGGYPQPAPGGYPQPAPGIYLVPPQTVYPQPVPVGYPQSAGGFQSPAQGGYPEPPPAYIPSPSAPSAPEPDKVYPESGAIRKY